MWGETDTSDLLGRGAGRAPKAEVAALGKQQGNSVGLPWGFEHGAVRCPRLTFLSPPLDRANSTTWHHTEDSVRIPHNSGCIGTDSVNKLLDCSLPVSALLAPALATPHKAEAHDR